VLLLAAHFYISHAQNETSTERKDTGKKGSGE